MWRRPRLPHPHSVRRPCLGRRSSRRSDPLLWARDLDCGLEPGQRILQANCLHVRTGEELEHAISGAIVFTMRVQLPRTMRVVVTRRDTTERIDGMMTTTIAKTPGLRKGRTMRIGFEVDPQTLRLTSVAPWARSLGLEREQTVLTVNGTKVQTAEDVYRMAQGRPTFVLVVAALLLESKQVRAPKRHKVAALAGKALLQMNLFSSS